MQRAEREMLIPMAAAAAPEPELRIAKARGWWIGVAATAAVVLIAVVATPFVRWSRQRPADRRATAMKGSDVLEKPPVPLSLAAADNAKGTVPAQQLDRRATASAKAGAGGAGNRNTTPVDLFAATPAKR